MKQSLFYETFKQNIIKCTLCPHYCLIPQTKIGACAVRKNIKGKLYSLNYGKAIATNIDPVEKKPLFHFLPGSKIYSFATAGCNFKCDFCQNWQISQISKGKEGQIIGNELSPSDIVNEAKISGCKSIAMTYTEPTIFFEYAYDVCKLAKKNNLKTAFVSNGYITIEAIDKISKYLDAINIDLKSFSDEFYKKVCGGRLQPVLDSIKQYHKNKVWVEITTLVLPNENDSPEELKKIAEFIASIDKNIPWHLSRFHPDYKMTKKSKTDINILEKALKVGKEAGLNYVYLGNVWNNEYENTVCPNCKEVIIKREGYTILKINMENNCCKLCKTKITGIYV